jgi:hypothetical protein
MAEGTSKADVKVLCGCFAIRVRGLELLAKWRKSYPAKPTPQLDIPARKVVCGAFAVSCSGFLRLETLCSDEGGESTDEKQTGE